jgi:hypothetical protein
MSSTILTPISIILTVAAALGVFIHDTQIYNASKASTLSIAVTKSARMDDSKLLSNDNHTHSDKSMFYGLKYQQPSNQPRSRDDKKYMAVKRLVGTNFSSEYSWLFS